jgi:hypothetical protein
MAEVFGSRTTSLCLWDANMAKLANGIGHGTDASGSKEDSQFRRKIAEQVNIGFEFPASEPMLHPKLRFAPKQHRYQRCRSTMKLKRKNGSPSHTICEP